jgi:mRNA interferase MazF
VLVLWTEISDAIIAAITSAVPRSSTDVSLADWKLSGLRTASTVRLTRLDCLEQSLFVARIGTISARDANNEKQVWAAEVKPRF